MHVQTELNISDSDYICPNQKLKQKRLNLDQADDSMTFLLSSGLLIDSPTLTSDVRLPTGEKVLSSKPVSIVHKQKNINEYKANYSVSKVIPFSDL